MDAMQRGHHHRQLLPPPPPCRHQPPAVPTTTEPSRGTPSGNRRRRYCSCAAPSSPSHCQNGTLTTSHPRARSSASRSRERPSGPRQSPPGTTFVVKCDGPSTCVAGWWLQRSRVRTIVCASDVVSDHCWSVRPSVTCAVCAVQTCAHAPVCEPVRVGAWECVCLCLRAPARVCT